MLVTVAKATPTRCNTVEALTIQQAFNWLRQNMDKLDEQMGKGGLSPWTGRARQRFTERLSKSRSRVTCSGKKACEATTLSRIRLGAWDLPIRHKTKIVLCTAQLSGLGQYVVTIAHELGHLVWANADRKACLQRCIQPRMSDSLSLAAYHAWHGTGHDPAQCPVLCGIHPIQRPPITGVEESGLPAVRPMAPTLAVPAAENGGEGSNSP